MSRYRLDKRRIQQSFDRAAVRYDEVAVLQREVGKRTLERMELIRHQPGCILDIGAGTGYCSHALLQRYRKAMVISADLSPAMLRVAAGRGSVWERWRRQQAFVAADIEQLPFADASVDLLFSNLTLQWCPDLKQAFSEIRRVLKPGGLLMFSTFGPDTLKELRESWQTVDDYTHVSAFADMHDIGDLVLGSQFADPVMDSERFTLTYKEVRELMQDLKILGAHNATAGRQRGLTGKQRFARMAEAYESYRQEGLLPATYEVVYGHAWAPEHCVSQPAEGGGSMVSLAQMRSAIRRHRP